MPVQFTTLADCLRTRAEDDGSRIAYTFLRDGERDESNWTYSELHTHASRIAAALRAALEPGDRVLLVYPPGVDFIAGFFGCLYAGMVAVPAYPPRPHQSLKTLEAVAADAGVVAAVTAAIHLPAMRRHLSSSSSLASLPWYTEEESIEGRYSPAPPAAARLAYLQYHLAPTGTPKGVMVTHENLMHNSAMIAEGLGNSERSVYVGWLPLFHDMGLVGLAMQSLFLGVRCVLFPAVYFLQKPVRWLQAIDRYRGTTSGAPNFAYDLCVRTVRPEQRDALDLGTWRVAFNAAEPVRADTLDRFVEMFGPCGFRREAFYPCYGLAEATVFVTGGEHERAPVVRQFDTGSLEQGVAVAVASGGRRLVGCGHSRLGQSVLVVDPESRERCAPGRVGEIWVSGPSVARGYWNRPRESEETFNAREARAEGHPVPCLRTGDLGFIEDDELFVTGRLKDLIIVRGGNYYPHDIEGTVQRAHAALRPAGGAAFSIEIDGEERLVVVQELQRSFRADATAQRQIVGDVREAVTAEHGLRVHELVLIKTGSLPRTTSGKIRRRACREQHEHGTLEVWGRG